MAVQSYVLQVGESTFIPLDGRVESCTMSQPGIIEYAEVPGGIVCTALAIGTVTITITFTITFTIGYSIITIPINITFTIFVVGL
jgi:hypothetical protein